jgi:hypothetical protein
MPGFETDLSDVSKAALLVLIVASLVPLLIWAFWDLEQRRQSWRAPWRGSILHRRDS